jgi:2-hydroxy-6-oxonona-2,4-dienedioate hydrolase
VNEQTYRITERQLWDELGVAPRERMVSLDRNKVSVRIQELGEGPPVLFIHGGPGAAGSVWASLAAKLPEFRCLLVDRPGTGLSQPQELADSSAIRRQSETFVADVLDGLGLGTVHVVGSSHGSYVALLSAVAHPERIDSTVHLGCPGFVEGMRLTAVDRLFLLPGMSRLAARFPANEKGIRKTLRQLGHSEGDAVISPATLDWLVALQRHTDTMRNELAAMTVMGTFRGGFDPSLTITQEALAQVKSPSYFLWGENDVYGGESVARRVVDSIPSAQLEMLPGAGHLCWIDDLDRAANVIRSHLND